MQHTKRVNHVKASRTQWQMKQVGLHNVHIFQVTGITKRSVYCRTEIHSDDLPSMLRREKQVATFATAGVKQDLAAKTLRRIRRKVPAKVGLALRAEIGEVPPFVTEATHGAQFAFLTGTRLDIQMLLRIREELRVFLLESGTKGTEQHSGDTFDDREILPALATSQPAAHDLRRILQIVWFRDSGQFQVPTARAHQILEQGHFH